MVCLVPPVRSTHSDFYSVPSLTPPSCYIRGVLFGLHVTDNHFLMALISVNLFFTNTDKHFSLCIHPIAPRESVHEYILAIFNFNWSLAKIMHLTHIGTTINSSFVTFICFTRARRGLALSSMSLSWWRYTSAAHDFVDPLQKHNILYI